MEGLNAAFLAGVATVLGVSAAALALWQWGRAVRARRQRDADIVVLQAAVEALGLRVARLESELHSRSEPERRASIATASPTQVEAGAADEIAGLARRIDALRLRLADAEPMPAGPDAASSIAVVHKDDLKHIDGIDDAIEKALNDAGFRSFRDIVSAKPDELAWALAAAGPILAATPTRHWADQARRLADARGTRID